MRGKLKTGALLVAIAVLFVAALPALAGQAEDRAKFQARVDRQMKAGGDIEARTATQLYTEYNANEVAADAKYKGKWVQVRGLVFSVAKDIAGKPYIAFAADSYGVGQVHAALFDVQLKDMTGKEFTVCTALEKAGAVKRGQKLMVECQGKGSIMGIPRLEQCLILPDGGK